MPPVYKVLSILYSPTGITHLIDLSGFSNFYHKYKEFMRLQYGKRKVTEESVEEQVDESEGVSSGDGYVEIKMGGGWYMTISRA